MINVCTKQYKFNNKKNSFSRIKLKSVWHKIMSENILVICDKFKSNNVLPFMDEQWSQYVCGLEYKFLKLVWQMWYIKGNKISKLHTPPILL